LTGNGLADEPELDAGSVHGKAGLPTRLWRWIDRRTGADALLRKTLDEPIPGGARLAFVFGSALLFIFVSQIITGLCLTLYYVPSPLAAHVTLAYIVKDVAAGAFLRSLHSYGSSAMIVVLVLHFLQTFLYGSYKGRRELLWISGCVLALVVLGMTFTGYLLRWDLKAYFAGSVGTNIAGDVPLIGGWLLRLLRGGAAMGALTLSRFYVFHVFLLPASIFLVVAIHLVLFRKAGAAGPMTEDAVHPRLPTETFYPKQVIIDMLFVLMVMGALGMLAHFVPEELGPVADPSNSNYLPRPEWYYLPFFEWLKFWDGAKTVIGVIVIPGILVGLVFLLPFLDRSPERRPWKRPIPVGGVLIVLIGLVGLGMQSRLDDARDPTTASQIARQELAEDQYFRAPFEPYAAASISGGAAAATLSAAALQGKPLCVTRLRRLSRCRRRGRCRTGTHPHLR
jgi:ubiquinol-cytochrome c reductase cytochrome b subunit